MKKWTLLFLLISMVMYSYGNDSIKLIYKFNIKQEIAPAVWHQTKKVFENAEAMDADLILIHMNTYGGTVVDADSIRTRILNSPIPVWVFIDNNAASAGALISIACDSIFMRPGANIGAATVVNQSGEKSPYKYQSYLRSIMRATAQSHGADTIFTENDTIIKWFRDPILAEAMVDEDVYVAGIIDTGKILTFTAVEAMKNGFCEGMAENIEDLLRQANIENYTIEEFQPTGIDVIIGFLTNPIVSGLLIMAIVGGIYFEMQSPGIGFPLIIAGIAAIAYFAPLYLEGLAQNWEIIIFVVGLVLIAVELFVIPGFGIAGISGITLSVSGLVLSLVDNVNFNFEGVDSSAFFVAVLTVTIALFGGFTLSIWLGQKIFTAQKGPFRKFSLQSIQTTTEGYIGVNTHQRDMVGKEAIAQTVLRPSGKVIIDGEIWDALSEDGFIDRNTAVQIIKQEATQLYVVKKS